MSDQEEQSKQVNEVPPPADAGLFGLDCDIQDSELVIIPVSWDATASYGRGASLAAKGIMRASHQLDLEDSFFEKPYEKGIMMLSGLDHIASENSSAYRDVKSIRSGTLSSQESEAACSRVNTASARVNALVEFESTRLLDQGKLVGILGGDHSSPLGYLKALSKRFSEFGILHIDAHFDLRDSYEGFEFSHASIMHNALKHCSSLKSLVQVGLRDYSQSELAAAAAQGDRVQVYSDAELYRSKAKGTAFAELAAGIIANLPQNVYLSFDIDGLEPSFCPGTGTPVPGGLHYHEAIYLIEQVVASGRTVIGFDLCEVSQGLSSSDWDFNVGARVLYKLCGAVLAQGQA